MLNEKEIALILGQDPKPEIVTKPLSFKEWMLTKKGIASLTVGHVDSYVKKMLRDNNTPFPTKDDADHIALRVLSSDLSKSYQKHLLEALELYMEFIGSPVKYRKPKPVKRSPKYLTQEQLKKLVYGSRDYRVFALIMMFITTGVRLNELRQMNIGDLDLQRRVVTVRHAKRARDREVPLSNECVKVMQIYLGKYHGKDPKPNEPLFVSKRGNRWSAHGIYSAIQRCAEKAGLQGMVSPHVLRHSFATAMVANGCDIYSLSGLMGHTNITTTSIYLHVNSDALRKAYEKGVPRLT